jgi:purine-binding chemotaxis protein CheW
MTTVHTSWQGSGARNAQVDRSQIVTFRLGDDLFAADIFAVERVLRFRAPTPVPNVPEWIDGVIDYQGRVVPVINLRRRFSLTSATASGATRILIFAIADEWIAAVVDAVLDVSVLDHANLAPPPALFRGLTAAYLRGIVRRGDRLVMFLDVAALLSASERLALTETSAGASRDG